MIWEVHQNTLGSSRVKGSKSSPSCPERPSFWPHVWAGILKTVGPAAPASWWGANAFSTPAPQPPPLPTLPRQLSGGMRKEGGQVTKEAKEAQEGGKTGECNGRRPRLAWEWSSSVPEPGLLLKHTNTLQQVLRQTHYSSAQYVFPCRKEPLSASSSWDVGCRTQSNGPALLRPLTLMPVRRRHQRPKIASASPTSHPGPCAFQGLPLQVDFIRGGERISGRRQFVVCFYSERPFPSKEGNLKTLIFSETFSKERFVSSTKSEHLIQNQFSQRLGPVSGANSDRQRY